MTGLAKLLYGINRIVLLLLALSFLSFYLVSMEGMDFLVPVVQYSTQYLPILLIPVTISMVIVLLIRYLAKSSDEKVTIGDVIAGIVALVCQIAAIVVYRAQGGEVSGDMLTNIPNLQELVPSLAEQARQLSESAGQAVEQVGEQAQRAGEAIGEAAGRAEEVLVQQSARYGILSVAALQFLAFGFYWFADPDPKPKSDDD